jgi:hypothetical protein
MSSTPNASHLKRPLRLDRPANSARLTKPFRSPLRSSSGHHQTDAAGQAKASHKLTRDDAQPTLMPAAVISADDIDVRADVDALYKQYRSISREITQMRQSLDTAQQATHIVQNNQTAAIEALIDKWKTVVRDAADELYSQAKVRIDHDPDIVRSRKRSFGSLEGEPNLYGERREMLQAHHEDDREQAIKYGLVDSIEDTGDDQQDANKVSSLQVFVGPLIHLSLSLWPQCFVKWMLI